MKTDTTAESSRDTMPAEYFKVLVGGRSCHGGDLTWSLPVQGDGGEWTPGEWHAVDGKIKHCENGLHLTSVPAKWWRDGATCFAVEYAGDVDQDASDDKIAVQRARLLRPLAVDQLTAHHIYLSGHHEITTGTGIIIGGSASASVSGSATIQDVSGSATIQDVSGSATIQCVRGSATIQDVSGSATIQCVRDSATIQDVRDSATIQDVSGSATIQCVRDSATVHARGHSTINTPPRAWGWHPTVTVAEHAVWIDRRSGKAVVHVVTEPTQAGAA